MKQSGRCRGCRFYQPAYRDIRAPRWAQGWCAARGIFRGWLGLMDMIAAEADCTQYAAREAPQDAGEEDEDNTP